MERLIDKISEQVIDDYVDRKLTKNIDNDGRSYLKICKKTQAFPSRMKYV